VNRPILIPGLPRAWRGPREIQLGSDPSRAVSIELPDPRAAQILDLLDGTRSERAALLRAAELGVPVEHGQALLATLQAAGLVLPAADLLATGLPHESRRRLIGEAAALAMARRHPADVLRRRAAGRVVFTGHGRLGAPIAVALAEAGVGAVQADVPGTVGPGELAGGPLRGSDLGRPRREAISDAVLRAAPGLRAPSVREPTATLVVQLDHSEPPDGPHLAVTIREGTPVIGPFVPTGGRPCLRCLDLHRQERDPAWPDPARRPLDPVQPCTVATLLAATAFATAEALTHLDGGRPQTLGTAVEITAPGRTRRRRWPPHPACACSAGRSDRARSRHQ